MKTSYIALVLALATGTAQAQAPAATIVLKDGTTATILSSSGKSTTYAMSVSKGADGKATTTQGEVFSGERIVKKPNGQCVEVRQRLMGFADFTTTAGQKLQLPHLETTEQAGACPK